MSSDTKVKNQDRKNLVQIVISSVFLSILLFAIVNALVQVNMNSTGIITVKGTATLKVFLEDKITENYELNWGTMDVESEKSMERWYQSIKGVKLIWTHNAPSYIQLIQFVDSGTGFWYSWDRATTLTMQSEWLHVSFHLKALAGAPAGAFSFTITITAD